MGGNTALPFSFPEEQAKDRISHSISYVKDAECKCTLLRMLRTVEHSQGTSEGEMSRIEDIFKMLKFLNLESWWMMGGWKSLTQLAIVLVCAWLRYAYIFFFLIFMLDVLYGIWVFAFSDWKSGHHRALHRNGTFSKKHINRSHFQSIH